MGITEYALLVYEAVGHKKSQLVSQTPDKYQELIDKTSFLPIKSTPAARSYCVVHNIESIPVCKTCGAILSYRPNIKAYPVYCSRSCTKKDAESIENTRKLTNLQRFGHTNASYSPELKEKRKKTMNAKYGVDHSMQSESLKSKHATTMRDRYGVTSYFQLPEFHEEMKQDNLINHGVEHQSQLESVKHKVKQTRKKNQSTYDYASGVEKRKQKMLDRHDREHTKQVHISLKSLASLNDKYFLYTEHITNKKSLLEIANQLGCGDTTVGRYMKKHNIPTHHYFSSIGETQVLDFVESLGFDDVQHNNRTVISPYELDIYIPSQRVAVEYCGLYWHSEQQGKDKHYHRRKFDLCAKQNIQLITIFEDEWISRTEQVKKKLMSLLHKSDQAVVYARNTTIGEVSSNDKRDFMNTNHIQSNGPGSINIGLYNAEMLVACMSFIMHADGVYYLNRYATSCMVVGGFSKLLRYFMFRYNWNTIISFADLRWSVGKLYKTTGWTLDSTLEPDYQYVKNNKRCHKFNFRRKFLPNLLEHFDPTLSERENCDNNGILRVWDCGKLRYVITKTP